MKIEESYYESDLKWWLPRQLFYLNREYTMYPDEGDFESRRKKKLISDVELASFVYTLFDIFGDFKYVGEVYFK